MSHDEIPMSASVADHPHLRRWLRLLAEVVALPGDPPALSGLDDVEAELSHRWEDR